MRSVRDPVRPRGQRWRAGTALVAALLLAACGGGGGAPEQPGADPAAVDLLGGDDDDELPGAYVKVDFDIRGDVELTGSASVGPLTHDLGFTNITCAQFAEGMERDGVRLFAFPVLVGELDPGGEDILATVGVWEYPGPGTYNQDDKLQAGPDRVGLNIDGAIYELDYDNPRTDLVIKPDGSGTWTFPELVDLDNGTVRGTIEGTMTWTCTE